MEWLNYHHLLYFWVVVREGGLVPAGRVLRLSHPTLSAQVHALEERLGQKLFTRVGRKLVPTDVGRMVYRYADEIFSIGNELLEAVRGRPSGQPLRLDVGVLDAVPKLEAGASGRGRADQSGAHRRVRAALNDHMAIGGSPPPGAGGGCDRSGTRTT